VTSLDVSPDGTTLATASGSGKAGVVRLWDAATGKSREPSATLPSWLWDVKYLPDGKAVVACDADGGIHFLDADRLEPAPLTGVPTIRAMGLIVAPDGTCVAAVNSDGKAELWDSKRRAPRGVVAVAEEPMNGGRFTARFSPDGKTFATGAWKYTGSDRGRPIYAGVLKLFDASDGREAATLLGQEGGIIAMAFAGDGKALATGSHTGSLILWDLAARTQKTRFVGHIGLINRLALSPDGKTLASGGEDGILRLWDPSTGRLLAALSGHEDSIEALTLSPDGAFVVTGSADNTVRLWDARPSPH
jgi:WD40 repeat protein